MRTESAVRMHTSARLLEQRGPIRIGSDVELTHDDLENLGIGFRAMDAALTGGGSGGVPGYVSAEPLETWLPGTLRTISTIRNIDQIVGITTVGRWEDEQIKVRVEEPAGHAQLYGDNTPIPFADIRTSIESRGVVRFEQGFSVGRLEDIRLSAAGYQAANAKRAAASESLDRSRNDVGFRGYHQDETNVYGLLNDPSLPAYKSYADGGNASGTVWLSASFGDLVKDFTRMVNQIEDQMGGHLQDDTQLQLVMPTGYREVFQRREAPTGVSFREWLTTTYPNIRTTSTPDFKGANGGADVAYLIAENVSSADESDITGATIIQAVPTRYMVLGSDNSVKGYVEDATNATAGVFVLRPWAIARYTISADG